MNKIISFDAYGTLFKTDSNDPVLRDLLGKEREDFVRTWRTKLLSYTWLYTLIDEWKDFEEISKLALQNTCLLFDLSIDQIQEEFLSIYASPILFDDVRETLSILKSKGYQLNILSNGRLKTLKKAAVNNEINTYLSQIFSAEQVKKYKVHPDIYALITQYYKVDPKDCYFVSGNSWDIAGAGKFGFKTIWINRSALPSELITKKSNHEVQTLMELIEIL